MGLRVTDPDFEERVLTRMNYKAWPDGSENYTNLQYTVTLPRLVSDTPGRWLACYEPVAETEAVSAHVSARIHALYNQLVAFNARLNSPISTRLDLFIDSQEFDDSRHCDHREWTSRRLTLDSPEVLPDLPFVNTLYVQPRNNCSGDFHGCQIRPFSPLMPFQCLVHLPNAEQLVVLWMWERPMPCPAPSWIMRDHFARPWEGLERDNRHAFGAAMLDPERFLCGRRIPASLTRAALHFWMPSCDDQSRPRPNLIHPADKDPESLGLRKLATQLRVFYLRALITPDLFPAPAMPPDQQWSHMRRLQIEFHPLAPDGRWYFIGPHGEDPHDSELGGWTISDTDYPPASADEAPPNDDDLHDEYGDYPHGDTDQSDAVSYSFRTHPCSARIEPLLAAFAKAITRDKMPHLEKADFFTYLAWAPKEYEYDDAGEPIYGTVHRWGVKYIAANVDDQPAAVVRWQVGDWRPSPEVLSLFQQLGSQEWLDLKLEENRNPLDVSLWECDDLTKDFLTINREHCMYWPRITHGIHNDSEVRGDINTGSNKGGSAGSLGVGPDLVTIITATQHRLTSTFSTLCKWRCGFLCNLTTATE